MLRVLLLFLALPGLSWAHGGGLDAKGCHHDRKTGGYHCHGAPGATVVPAGGQSGSATHRNAQSLMSSPQALTPRSAASYANCSEARAAGAAPVRAGDPGYSRKLDRDGDGVGCE
jgi:hypothetical protein